MHNVNALRRALEYAADRDVSAGKTGDAWPADIERREARRYGYSTEGTATLVHRDRGAPVSIEPDFPIITVSLSRAGTAFLTNYDLQPDDLIELVLPAADGGNKVLKVRVARTRRVGLNAFEIGAVFAESDQTVPTSPEPPVPKPTAENRPAAP